MDFEVALMDTRNPAIMAAVRRFLNTPGVILDPSKLTWGRPVVLFTPVGTNADGPQEYRYIGPVLVIAVARQVNTHVLCYADGRFDGGSGQLVPIDDSQTAKAGICGADNPGGRSVVVDPARLALAVLFG
jgi:hypothetical protein